MHCPRPVINALQVIIQCFEYMIKTAGESRTGGNAVTGQKGYSWPGACYLCPGKLKLERRESVQGMQTCSTVAGQPGQCLQTLQVRNQLPKGALSEAHLAHQLCFVPLSQQRPRMLLRVMPGMHGREAVQAC